MYSGFLQSLTSVTNGVKQAIRREHFCPTKYSKVSEYHCIISWFQIYLRNIATLSIGVIFPVSGDAINSLC